MVNFHLRHFFVFTTKPTLGFKFPLISVAQFTNVKTDNLLQVVNRREQCYAAPREQCCAAPCEQCCAAPCEQCCVLHPVSNVVLHPVNNVVNKVVQP